MRRRHFRGLEQTKEYFAEDYEDYQLLMIYILFLFYIFEKCHYNACAILYREMREIVGVDM